MKTNPSRTENGTGNTSVTLRVLVVEDSEDDALLLLRELERGGYEPAHERVETPEAMRRALAEGGPWDMVISDYQMPRFRSSEALAIFRESGSEAPFIVVSGMVGEEVVVEAIKTGAHDYVMKDNLTRLTTTVKRGLDEARERRERRRAERELRESEARFRTVYESAPIGIANVDAEGRFVRTNRAFQEMLGYTEDELCGLSFEDLTHPDDVADKPGGARAVSGG